MPRTSAFPRRATILVATLALLAPGCRYFRPAQPEVGENLASFEAKYGTIDETLETLRLAIQDKSTTIGQSAYIGGFADPTTDAQGFSATFDPITVARFSNPSLDWTFQKEEQFYSNLSRLLPTATFVFSWGEFRGAPDDDIQATTAVLYRSYVLDASPDEGQTYVHIARGNAELHLVLLGTKWKIVQWVDSEDPLADFTAGEQSFGQLRLAGP